MPSRKNRPTRSIRFRLTVLYVTIFATTLIAFSAFLYSAFTYNRRDDFDNNLHEHALSLVEELRRETGLKPRADHPPAKPGEAPSQPPELLLPSSFLRPFLEDQTLIQIIDMSRKIVVRSRSLAASHLPVNEQDLNAAEKHGKIFTEISAQDIYGSQITRNSHYRMLTYLVQNKDAGQFFLQVAAPTTHLDYEKVAMLIFFIVGVPFALLFAAAGGLFLSGHALAPVSAILEKLRQLRPSNLTERIPVPTADDELRALSVSMNELLDRIQLAFESQERFVADASHELKTPLAIIHSELDELHESPKSPEQINQFLTSASQEVHHLIRLVEDLLLLARIDAGSACLVIQPYELDEALFETISRLDRPARAKNVKIRLNFLGLTTDSAERPDFGVSGDPVLVGVMFKNLIENAVKFSPEGATVDIEVENLLNAFRITVADRGPGIPPDVLPRIFERFYRGTTAVRTAGVGLGLAISRRIADIHGIRLDAESVVGVGTKFHTEIPKN